MIRGGHRLGRHPLPGASTPPLMRSKRCPSTWKGRMLLSGLTAVSTRSDMRGPTFDVLLSNSMQHKPEVNHSKAGTISLIRGRVRYSEEVLGSQSKVDHMGFLGTWRRRPP